MVPHERDATPPALPVDVVENVSTVQRSGEERSLNLSRQVRVQHASYETREKSIWNIRQEQVTDEDVWIGGYWCWWLYTELSKTLICFSRDIHLAPRHDDVGCGLVVGEEGGYEQTLAVQL